MLDTLYYDGSCPLCTKEVRLLRKLQDGTLAFADIHEPADNSLSLPHPSTQSQTQTPSKEMLLRRLHLQTENGHWVVGLPANVRAWSHTRYGLLLKPLLWPGLYLIAKYLYERWADRRYEKKYDCGSCQP